MSFDLHNQIELWRAKRAAAPENLAPEKLHVRQFVQVNVQRLPDPCTIQISGLDPFTLGFPRCKIKENNLAKQSCQTENALKRVPVVGR